MIRVEDPEAAVRLGLRIVDELALPGSPPVRVGMHSGPAVPRDGDWYGGTVNLAARVVGAARAGEVLLTRETMRQSGESDDFELEPGGSRAFRHLPEPVAIYRAVGSGGTGHHLEIDPVCRMAVDPADAAGTRHRRGYATTSARRSASGRLPSTAPIRSEQSGCQGREKGLPDQSRRSSWRSVART